MAEADFDDVVFHKSTHPISPGLKRQWGKSELMAERLRRANLAAAAVRIPATPTDAMIAKAGRTALLKAAPTLAIVGAKYTFDDVDDILRRLTAATTATQEASIIQEARSWGETHGAAIALAAGVLQALAARTTGTQTQDTVLKAYSIRKAMQTHPGEVSRGESVVKVAKQLDETAMAAGKFAFPNKF